MPEGDTIYRTAVVLRRALQGRAVARFETTIPAVAAVDERLRVAGRVIRAVDARGKHLLITMARPSPDEGAAPVDAAEPPPARDRGDLLILHTHMMMTGSWHVYRPGEAWSKPARRAVVVLHTDAFVAPCFSAPVVELLTERALAQHPRLGALGPDAITDSFDALEARARLRRRPELPIGVALLNQRALAGVGNVFKSEVLFRQRVSPFRPVGELTDAVLEPLIADCHQLLVQNRGGPLRRTMPGLDERERLFVYNRSGEPCRVCGAPIRMRRQGMDARSTYFCPRCQDVA